MPKDTVSTLELSIWSLDKNIKRIAEASNGLQALTAQVARLADAVGVIALTLNCLTESVEGLDGETRCTLRSHKMSPHILAVQGYDK